MNCAYCGNPMCVHCIPALRTVPYAGYHCNNCGEIFIIEFGVVRKLNSEEQADPRWQGVIKATRQQANRQRLARAARMN